MKRIRYGLTLLTILLLTACAGGIPPAENGGAADAAPAVPSVSAPQEEAMEKEPAVPEYSFEFILQAEEFTASDGGEVYSSYSYSLPRMAVSNPDDLSDRDYEVAQRNVTAFNAEMERVMTAAVAAGESLADDIRYIMEEQEILWSGADELESTVTRTGEIITVRTDCYYYGGGAHPTSYSLSYTFDLSVGQFIDPAQIADDPEFFRQRAAEMLVEQAENMGEDYTSGYWDDYASIISRWNDTAVFFDENGMTVYFSVYELGPYAMGPVELFLDYEALAEALGSGGLRHLGVRE